MSDRRSTAFLALSCVGALVSAPAMAQQGPSDQGPIDQGPQTTQDRRDDPRRDDIVVTGVREDEGVESPKATAPLLDTPQTITVISDQTLRKQNLLTLRDALSTVPGITFGAGEGGGGYGDSINLRGYSANNDITVDGVRDSAQYSRTDPFNLQQIEVYNGANTVFNGSGSVGGTINLVSKVPQRESLTIVSGGIGTDDYYRGTVDSNVRVNELVAVRLNAMVHQNGYVGRDVEEYERWGVAPAITIGVEGPTSLTIAYVHQEDDNTPLYGVPYYPLGGGIPDGIDRSDYFGIVNLDRQETTLDRLTATFSHQFSDAVSVRNLTRWQRVHQPSVTSSPEGTVCLVGNVSGTGTACAAGQQPGFFYPAGPRGFERDQLNQQLHNQTDLTVRTGQAGAAVRNTLVIGASASVEDYEIVSAQLLRNPGGALPNPVQPPISIADPDTVYRGPLNRIETGRSVSDQTYLAVYAFDTLELGPVELNGGVRYEKVEGTFRADTFATPAAGGAITRGAPQVTDEELFSYRGGVVFKPSDNASLYASYANSKSPSSATVRLGCGVNCEVEPETGRSYEVGGKIDLMNRRLQLTAAAFRNDRSNYRVALGDPIVPALQVVDGSARVDGIALGATGNITPALTIFANYTYLDSKVRQSVSDACLDTPSTTCGNSAAVLDPQAGDELVGTPEHSGSLFTTYTLPFGLQLGYGLTYTGSFAVNTTTLAQPVQFRSDDWLTHRAFLSYAFDNGLTAQLNVQNFTNERYLTTYRTTNGNGWALPGERRSAVVSLFYSF